MLKYLRPSFEGDFRLRPVHVVLLFSAGLQAVGAFGIYVKWIFLKLTITFMVVSRFIGRATSDGLSLGEKASFFRWDVLIHLAAVPLLLGCIGAFLPRRLGWAFVSFCCLVLCGLHLAALCSLSETGQFLTWDLLRDSVAWGWAHPEQVSTYVSPSATLKTVAVAAIGIAISALSMIRSRGASAFLLVRFVSTASVAIALFALAFTVSASTEAFRNFPQQKPAIALQIQTLADSPPNELKQLETPALQQRYRSLTGTNSCPTPSTFSGSAGTLNVLQFVLETGPKKSFDIARSRGALPTVDELAAHGLEAQQHYSTYPYTSDATYSLYTGNYPQSRRFIVQSDTDGFNAALTKRLRRRGYSVGFFAPSGDTFEPDSRMFRQLGATGIFVPGPADMRSREVVDSVGAILASVPAQVRDRGTLKSRLAADIAALKALESDLAAAKRNNQRFFFTYLPQIGHGPWPDITGVPLGAKRGAAVMALQDAWLGEIVMTLRKLDLLDSTIIVVTADHGVRTRSEDPAFRGGTISEYTFHVPLIIRLPGELFTSPMRVETVTSHIDVAPTLEALLGEAGGGSQGVAIWCNSLSSRVTYFFADEYLGASGYHVKGEFAMREQLTGAAYRASRMDFGTADLQDILEAQRIDESLDAAAAVSAALNRRLAAN